MENNKFKKSVSMRNMMQRRLGSSQVAKEDGQQGSSGKWQVRNEGLQAVGKSEVLREKRKKYLNESGDM